MCPICLTLLKTIIETQEKTVVVYACGHICCKDCFDELLKNIGTNHKCSVCRA